MSLGDKNYREGFDLLVIVERKVLRREELILKVEEISSELETFGPREERKAKLELALLYLSEVEILQKEIKRLFRRIRWIQVKQKVLDVLGI